MYYVESTLLSVSPRLVVKPTSHIMRCQQCQVWGKSQKQTDHFEWPRDWRPLQRQSTTRSPPLAAPQGSWCAGLVCPFPTASASTLPSSGPQPTLPLPHSLQSPWPDKSWPPLCGSRQIPAHPSESSRSSSSPEPALTSSPKEVIALESGPRRFLKCFGPLGVPSFQRAEPPVEEGQDELQVFFFLLREDSATNFLIFDKFQGCEGL